MKKILTSFVIIFLTSCSTTLLAQQSFEVKISSDSVLLGNYITLEFVAQNIEGQIEAPDLNEFEVLSGPNMSSSFQFTNGSSTRSVTYSYRIKPSDLGVYMIGPAYITEKETTLETSPLEIHVYPNPDGIIEEPKQSTSEFNFGFEDFPEFKEMTKPKKKKTDPRLKRI